MSTREHLNLGGIGHKSQTAKNSQSSELINSFSAAALMGIDRRYIQCSADNPISFLLVFFWGFNPSDLFSVTVLVVYSWKLLHPWT
jgi:hypothetical protein